MLPGAARRGRSELAGITTTIDEHGLDGLRPMVEYLLALLAKHQRRTKEARSHLEAVQQLLSAEPYAFVRNQAVTALAEL